MNAMTDEEVRQFEEQNHWATGLKIDESGRGFYYDNVGARCIALGYPEGPMRVPYFTRVLSLLNVESEEHFYGALLWLTLWTIGSPGLEKIGWKLVEKMRLAFGETRPIGVAPGHWFRSDEFVELNAFLLPCFIFGWDAYYVPSGQDYFVHISHDEYWVIVTKTTAAYDNLFKSLQPLSPRDAPMGITERFCRHTSETTH
ncbi:MAG: hypothetical protein WA213_13135 [Terriglobales bacterium]